MAEPQAFYSECCWHYAMLWIVGRWVIAKDRLTIGMRREYLVLSPRNILSHWAVFWLGKTRYITT